MINSVKTALLLATLSGLFLAIGALLGGYEGIKIALIFSLITNFITYYFSASIVLRMYGAQRLDRAAHTSLYTTVEKLARSMGLPMPTLWLIKTPMANAFATGRNPSNAAIAVTTGIIELLSERELRGVLAHELAHIKNRDILIGTIAATIASAIGAIASMLRYSLYFGSSRDRERGSTLVGTLLISLIMPLAAALIQCAISRSREYQADHTGASSCDDPDALADALKKLHAHIPYAGLDRDGAHYATTASLFIVHPFTSGGLVHLFSTHPPLHERIKRLEKMHGKDTRYNN